MASRHASSGFTMVELIVIMIILGILAVVAIPRMDSATAFRAVEFRDQTIAALRFAQKTATSHRRMVCAEFASDRVTLTIDDDKNGSCNSVALSIPGNSTNTPNVLVSPDATNGVFASAPAPRFFQTDGRITADAAGNIVAGIDTTIDGSRVYANGTTGFIADAP
jgi:Tfp pilus assembly protein FimT